MAHDLVPHIKKMHGREPHAAQHRRGALHPVPELASRARPTRSQRLPDGAGLCRPKTPRSCCNYPRLACAAKARSTSPSRTSAGSGKQIKLIRELVQLPLTYPARLSPPRHQPAARHHPLRAAGLGQNASGARRRQRGRRALLLHQRSRRDRHLYRRDRGQSAPHVQRGEPSRAVDHLHRRARRAWRPSAARPARIPTPAR